MPVTFKVLAPYVNVANRKMGVDPSTHTGVVILEGDKLLLAITVTHKGVDGYTRLQSIAAAVLSYAEYYAVKDIYIERPVSMGAFNMVLQASIGCLIRDRLFTNKRPWHDVSPTTLKKWATGSGRAKKKDMAAAVLSRWGYSNKDDNIIDAYALARLAQHADSFKAMKGVQVGDSALVLT